MKIRNVAVVRLSLLGAAVILWGFSSPLNKAVDDFRLQNVDSRYVSLKDYPKAKGFIVVFTCNHCPFAKLYFQRLKELNDKYKALGIPVIAISSTDTVNFEEDSRLKMKEKAKKEKLNFPYLYDGGQSVAKNFTAQKTPHAFVVWIENGRYIIKYSGAIDDNGADPSKVKNPYVAKAVDALLNSKDVEIKETRSIGCQIQLRQ